MSDSETYYDSVSTTPPPPQSEDEILSNLSIKFKPSEEFYHNGNTLSTQVFNILRSERNDVDRVIVAESIGKRSDIVTTQIDFNLVIFLNDKEPPFTAVLNQLKSTLTQKRLQDFKFIKQTRTTIVFDLGGYTFDLAPARNYKSNSSSQHDGTLKKIGQLAHPIRDGYLYSPGLAESTVQFLKNKSPFVHSFVQLAKYWNSSIKIDEYIGGRTLMIELLAIVSCESEIWGDSGETKSLYVAFKQFLNHIKKFGTLMIHFHEKSEVPYNIETYKGAVILDPINYYNNLAHHQHISYRARESLKASAINTLMELDDWMVNPMRIAVGADGIINIFSKIREKFSYTDSDGELQVV